MPAQPEARIDLLDLRGPEFLAVYIGVMIVATIVATCVRLIFSGTGDQRTIDAELEPYDAAYLIGGPDLVMRTAIVSLVHTGALALSGATKLKEAGIPASSATPIEREVFDLMHRGDARISAIRGYAKIVSKPIHENLVNRGLACNSQQSLLARLVPAMIMLGVLGLGVTKLCIGVSRNKPVGFLILLCMLTVPILIFFILQPPYRTAAGRQLIRSMRMRHAALKTTASTAWSRLSSADLALAVSLFGAIAISSPELNGLKSALWGSTGDGGSSGSSCGGGGGCGGGGCGGCGGG